MKMKKVKKRARVYNRYDEKEEEEEVNDVYILCGLFRCIISHSPDTGA
jgi:hypothetical protein